MEMSDMSFAGPAAVAPSGVMPLLVPNTTSRLPAGRGRTACHLGTLTVTPGRVEFTYGMGMGRTFALPAAAITSIHFRPGLLRRNRGWMCLTLADGQQAQFWLKAAAADSARSLLLPQWGF
jgi:hypothetical protein